MYTEYSKAHPTILAQSPLAWLTVWRGWFALRFVFWFWQQCAASPRTAAQKKKLGGGFATPEPHLALEKASRSSFAAHCCSKTCAGAVAPPPNPHLALKKSSSGGRALLVAALSLGFCPRYAFKTYPSPRRVPISSTAGSIRRSFWRSLLIARSSALASRPGS